MKLSTLSGPLRIRIPFWRIYLIVRVFPGTRWYSLDSWRKYLLFEKLDSLDGFHIGPIMFWKEKITVANPISNYDWVPDASRELPNKVHSILPRLGAGRRFKLVEIPGGQTAVVIEEYNVETIDDLTDAQVVEAYTDYTRVASVLIREPGIWDEELFAEYTARGVRNNPDRTMIEPIIWVDRMPENAAEYRNRVIRDGS